MKYKNASNSTVRIDENKLIAPGAEVDLTEDDEQNPDVVSAKDWGWLIPIAETVIGDVLKPKEVKNDENNQ